MGKDCNTITALGSQLQGGMRYSSCLELTSHKMNSLTLLLDLNNIFFRKWIKILNNYSMHMYVSLQELCGVQINIK